MAAMAIDALRRGARFLAADLAPAVFLAAVGVAAWALQRITGASAFVASVVHAPLMIVSAALLLPRRSLGHLVRWWNAIPFLDFLAVLVSSGAVMTVIRRRTGINLLWSDFVAGAVFFVLWIVRGFRRGRRGPSAP